MHGASSSGTSTTPGPSDCKITRKPSDRLRESSNRSWVIGLGGGNARVRPIISVHSSQYYYLLDSHLPPEFCPIAQFSSEPAQNHPILRDVPAQPDYIGAAHLGRGIC